MEYASGLYVLNGIFIQAMVEEGYVAKCNYQDGPNANVNIDKRSIKRTHDAMNAVPSVSAQEYLARCQ
jgi:hypothetical protein